MVCASTLDVFEGFSRYTNVLIIIIIIIIILCLVCPLQSASGKFNL